MNRQLPDKFGSMSSSGYNLNPVEGPSVWYGPEMAQKDNWIYRLSENEIAEIDHAIHKVRRRNLPMKDIRKEDFFLPKLGPELLSIRNEIIEGRGFIVIRGFPVEDYTLEDAATSYWGIGTYFGKAISQNSKGHLLGHVRDIGNDPKNPLHRIYTTHEKQRYHTDSCDIVGLLCLKPAKSGGKSTISSSDTVYNEMLKTRPDLVDTLSDTFYFDWKGEEPPGSKSYFSARVFNNYDGFLSTTYDRNFITSAQRFKELPSLKPIQIEAIDMLEDLANSDDIRLDIEFKPGDMQFIHNHQVLHARTAYEDFAEPDLKRHLLRLWLTAPNRRPLPPEIELRYNGIKSAGGNYSASLDPNA